MDKIKICQENYNEILKLALESTSVSDVIAKLGYKKSSTAAKNVGILLAQNKFNINQFMKIYKESNCVFNDKEKLSLIVSKSGSYSQVIDRYSLTKSGGQLKKLKEMVDKFGISTTHFKTKPVTVRKRLTQEDIFLANSDIDRGTVKKNFKKISEYICKGEAGCNNTGIWFGKKLSLELDHINGFGNDNRIENLRFICSNCHSLTETNSGGNKKMKKDAGKTLISHTEDIFKDNLSKLLSIINNFNSDNEILSLLSVAYNESSLSILEGFLNNNLDNEKISSYLNRRSDSHPLEHKMNGLERLYEIETDKEALLNELISLPNKEAILKYLKVDSHGKKYRYLNKFLKSNKNDSRVIDFLKKIDITYPAPEDLLQMVLEIGYRKTAIKINTTDNSIRKHLKKNGLVFSAPDIKKLRNEKGIVCKTIMSVSKKGTNQKVWPHGMGWCGSCKCHKTLDNFTPSKLILRKAPCHACIKEKRAMERKLKKAVGSS